jgi:hypothetical protein
MKTMISAIFGLLALVLVGQAAALPTLSLLPASQTAVAGDNVSLDLVIDGLGNFAPDSLGNFDVEIGYDAAVLSFQSLTLGAFLGDVGLGEAIDFSLGDLGGVVNVAELSLLDPDPFSGPSFFGPYLDDIQPGSFTLATLDFHVDILAPGSSTTVSISSVNILGDGFGNLLTLDSTNDAVIRGPQISIPEPSILALLGLGLFGIGAVRRSRRKP